MLISQITVFHRDAGIWGYERSRKSPEKVTLVLSKNELREAPEAQSKCILNRQIDGCVCFSSSAKPIQPCSHRRHLTWKYWVKSYTILMLVIGAFTKQKSPLLLPYNRSLTGLKNGREENLSFSAKLVLFLWSHFSQSIFLCVTFSTLIKWSSQHKSLGFHLWWAHVSSVYVCRPWVTTLYLVSLQSDIVLHLVFSLPPASVYLFLYWILGKFLLRPWYSEWIQIFKNTEGASVAEVYSDIESKKKKLEKQAEIKLCNILQIMFTSLNMTLSVMRNYWKWRKDEPQWVGLLLDKKKKEHLIKRSSGARY